MERSEVYKLIDDERAYQHRRWNANTTASKGLHSPTEFMAYIESYARKALDHVTTNPEPRASQECLDTIRKIAALAVSCMEQNGAVPRIDKDLL